MLIRCTLFKYSSSSFRNLNEKRKIRTELWYWIVIIMKGTLFISIFKKISYKMVYLVVLKNLDLLNGRNFALKTGGNRNEPKGHRYLFSQINCDFLGIYLLSVSESFLILWICTWSMVSKLAPSPESRLRMLPLKWLFW